MSRPQQSASPITLAALFGLVAAGTVLLAIGAWALIRNNDDTTTGAEVAPAAPADETSSGAGPTGEPEPGAGGGSGSGSGGVVVDEDVFDRVEESPEILVRGDTDQGWVIESPDGYGFYPLGGAGPDLFTDTTSAGFAQTPEGAGLAAIHILQRARPVNDGWRTTVDTQIVGAGAAGYAAAIEALVADEDALGTVLEASALKNAWVGWNVVGFDPQVAELRLAGIGSIDGDEVRYILDVRLEWLDGDWRLVTTTADGTDLSAVSRVAELGQLDVDMRSAFAL